MAQAQLPALQEVSKTVLAASARAALQSAKVDAARVEAAANKILVGQWVQTYEVGGSVEVNGGCLQLSGLAPHGFCGGAFGGKTTVGNFKGGAGEFSGVLVIDSLSNLIEHANTKFFINDTPDHTILLFFYDDWSLMGGVLASAVPCVSGSGFGQGNWYMICPATKPGV